MSQLKVYHYAQCGTCRKAVKWLEARGHELELHPIKEEPPGVEELRGAVQASGLPLKKFFNTSGEVYKQLGLKDKLASMSEQEQLELLSSNGMLIKRPVVIGEGKATAGFKEEEYQTVWGGEA